MPTVLNSLRVSVPNWKDEAAFSALLDFLREYRDCVQQIAFFSSDFHPPQPLETAAAHAALLRDRIRRAKAEGFSCGVNVLSTVGHHPERLTEALQGDWPRLTNIDGETCAGSFCPADERYREEYVRPLYEIYCRAAPDFIWVDDDIRSAHLPVGYGCFCDGCLERFNRCCGGAFTRAGLKQALTDSEGTALRKRWLRFESETIASLLRSIGETVRAVDDGITLGFMTGERYFEGYDFALWVRALSDDGAYPIMWRPGGGAYTDRPFAGQLEKARQIGRQCARLQGYVVSVQSEIENFPYRVLQKSPRATALEVLLHTAAGCTGAALNVLPDAPQGEPVEVMRGHFEALRAAVPFERLLSETLDRAPTEGIYDGWHIDAQAALDVDFLRGGGGCFPQTWAELFSLGLPGSHDFGRACCYLLTGTSPRAFSGEELLHILSSGVYLDARALEELNRLGYGELTGFSAGDPLPEDSMEIYASHPLNAGLEGKRRLCPQVFVKGGSAALLPSPGAQTLCFLTDHRGGPRADCSMGWFKNRLGGRVCVSSHYAAVGLSDSLKSVQMKRVFRALSGDSLPFLVQSCVRLEAVARRAAEGTAVVLLNPNFDTLTDVAVLFRGNAAALRMTREDGRTFLLPALGRDGNMTRYSIPELPPYTTALLQKEKEV